MTTPTPTTFSADLAAARSGDHDAFVRLVGPLRSKHRSMAASDLAGYAGGEALVDDVLNEAESKCWTRLEQFGGSTDGEFKGWVGTIVRNVVRDEQRSFRRENAHAIRPGAMDMESLRDELVERVSHGIATGLSRQELRDRVLAMIGELPEDHRLVMEAWLGGETFAEIDRRLGVHKGRSSRLARWAIAHMRERVAHFDSAVPLKRNR